MSLIASSHRQVSRALLGSDASDRDGCHSGQLSERVAAGASAAGGAPAPQGLYDPALDRDSCGVGFIADIKGRQSRKIVVDALTILLNLEHRGSAKWSAHRRRSCG